MSGTARGLRARPAGPLPVVRPLCRFWSLLALPLLLLLSGCGESRPGRVLILGLDGVDPRAVDLLMSEGKMPNFARLRQFGAYGTLQSQEPMLSPILWTTIATGRLPSDHGIGHFVAIDPEDGRERPVTSDLRSVRALWNIASESGRRVLTVGWWATWPPEEVDGMVVSDRTAYHFLFSEGLEGERALDATYPPQLAERIEPWLVRPEDVTPEELADFVDGQRMGGGNGTPVSAEMDFDDELSHLRWALAAGRSYRDVGLELWRRERPDLGLVYIEGVDSASHLFGHLFRAAGLAGELASQQRRFGGTVEAMYRFADELVGRYLDALDSDTTLVVLSDHGFDLGTLHDDPSKTRDLRRVSERFHNEHGILYLYGRGVTPGARLQDATLLDVAPTILWLLGLPAGRDMPGRLLEEGLRLPPPPERIASWEESARAPDQRPAPGDREALDEAVLARLRSLGYLDADPGGSAAAGTASRSPQGERNLAAIAFREGRYAEAEAIYRRLLERSPEEASLYASLAGVLGARGKFDEAEGALRRAVELEPVNPEAYHNLAVIAERRGDPEGAVRLYREAVRYAPDYDPPRAALLRLTGSPAARQPADEEEAAAWELAESAALAARRGDYGEAIRLLDEAERRSPESVLVFQYRSNVAYLMGDRPGAIEALEKALKLEPDNALFRRNLERLRAEEGGR